MGEQCFARFMVEKGKSKPRGRTSLYTPPKNGRLSVFTANAVDCGDLTKAGIYVAKQMNKNKLFGWSYMKERSFSEHDLTVIPDPCISFGASRHTNICGWPPKHEDRIEIVHKLTVKECGRKVFENPIAVS